MSFGRTTRLRLASGDGDSGPMTAWSSSEGPPLPVHVLA
jgi:hypothetical protein